MERRKYFSSHRTVHTAFCTAQQPFSNSALWHGLKQLEAKNLPFFQVSCHHHSEENTEKISKFFWCRDFGVRLRENPGFLCSPRPPPHDRARHWPRKKPAWSLNSWYLRQGRETTPWNSNSTATPQLTPIFWAQPFFRGLQTEFRDPKWLEYSPSSSRSTCRWARFCPFRLRETPKCRLAAYVLYPVYVLLSNLYSRKLATK